MADRRALLHLTQGLLEVLREDELQSQVRAASAAAGWHPGMPTLPPQMHMMPQWQARPPRMIAGMPSHMPGTQLMGPPAAAATMMGPPMMAPPGFCPGPIPAMPVRPMTVTPIVEEPDSDDVAVPHGATARPAAASAAAAAATAATAGTEMEEIPVEEEPPPRSTRRPVSPLAGPGPKNRPVLAPRYARKSSPATPAPSLSSTGHDDDAPGPAPAASLSSLGHDDVPGAWPKSAPDADPRRGVVGASPSAASSLAIKLFLLSRP